MALSVVQVQRTGSWGWSAAKVVMFGAIEVVVFASVVVSVAIDVVTS